MTAATASAALAAIITAAQLVAAAGANAAETPDAAPSPDALTPKMTQPLDAAALEALSAGAAGDTNVLSSQQVSAANSGATVNAETVQSGDIDLTDSAFAGFSGIGNFVFNTGANNNLQGVVSVNIVGAPGP